jgi:ribosomal protein L11 methyltransferase
MYHTRLQVQCEPDFTDILIAELAELGFDTFQESEEGFEAYAEEENFDRPAVEALKEKYKELTTFTLSFDKIPKRNWNEEWEKSYEPIIVDDRCLIRAEFHKIDKKYPYEITITPKMSFGTGHHQTTYLMVKAQMDIDHKGKRVMDAGCGTAILAIMASKLGATEVEAFDIDEWSTVNGKENIEINNCPNIHLQQGKITEVNLTGRFEVILANINKNVLLDEIKIYSTFLSKEGVLLLSGFYTHDIDDLLAEAGKYGLKEAGRDERESWASLKLRQATA